MYSHELLITDNRAAALTSQNQVTKHFCMARAQWQLNGSYCLTCPPGRVAAQSNRHGNCDAGRLTQ